MGVFLIRLFQMDFLSPLKIKARRKCEKVSVNYAVSSPDARRDLRECRVIWKKCCLTFLILDLERLPWDLVAAGEVFLGKEKF